MKDLLALILEIGFFILVIWFIFKVLGVICGALIGAFGTVIGIIIFMCIIFR